jgi:hypothetical protein
LGGRSFLHSFRPSQISRQFADATKNHKSMKEHLTVARNFSKDGGAFWGDSGRDAKPGFGVKHGSKKNKGEKVSLKTVQGVTHNSKKAETVAPLNGRGEYGVPVRGVPEDIHVGGSRENEYVANCGRGAREKSDSPRREGRHVNP